MTRKAGNAMRLLELLVCLIIAGSATIAQSGASGLTENSNEALMANEQGVALVKSGKYANAAVEFERAVKLNPDFAVGYNNLGATYNSLARYEDAIVALRRAIQLAPKYAEAHYDLGVAFHNLGRYGEAIEAYERAIHFNQTSLSLIAVWDLLAMSITSGSGEYSFTSNLLGLIQPMQRFTTTSVRHRLNPVN